VNARENALRIIHFDSPECVVGGPPLYNLCYLGCHHEGFAGGGHDCPVGTRWTDIWGTAWHKELEGVMGFPRGHPLSQVSALAHYRWPDPNDERILAKLHRLAEEFSAGDQFLAGQHRDTLWEKSYMLVGMENLMRYFHTEPAFVREVLGRIMDFQLGIASTYLRSGVEFVSFGDDLGTQQGPLLSPDIVAEFLLPQYRRLFRLYKEHGVLIGFHCCGNLDAVIDMFLDLGVDVLNPIQVTANNLDKIRERTQGKMALAGAVSTVTIMAGPPERIAAEVRERLWQLGREGGYFCGPDQGLPFPKEHIDALWAAVEEFGRYPLRPAPRVLAP
jgi:uroporphyrinogen decarboxylase